MVDMHEVGHPTVFEHVQDSLHPYVVSRQEGLQIRSKLATCILSQAPHHAGLSGILNVLPESSPVDLPSSLPGSLYKDYLKAVRSREKAQEEYDLVRSSLSPVSGTCHAVDTNHALTTEIAHSELMDVRQNNERMQVLQRYLQSILDKSVALESQLDSVLQSHKAPRTRRNEDTVAEPPVASSQHDREVMVYELEKAVIAAKATLKQERISLQNVGSRKERGLNGNQMPSGKRMHALSRTRSKLIEWVETELEKVSEVEASAADAQMRPFSKQEIAQHLEDIHSLYAAYVAERKRLVRSLVDIEMVDSPIVGVQTTPREQPVPQQRPASDILPSLVDHVSISREQKSLIQQRSYLTTGLLKQYEEAILTLDRLADESHLTHTYPLPSVPIVTAQTALTSFADDLQSTAPSNLRSYTKAWTFAAALAANNTKDTVDEHFEQGSNAIESARQALEGISSLLGHGSEINLWSLVDGNIGVLGREE